MTHQELLAMVDHTLLKQDATWEQIKNICDEGMHFHCASVCIPPSFVKQASEYVAEQCQDGTPLPICTVIGFPNGYMTTGTKIYECVDAMDNGATEIDMVINIGWVKERQYHLVQSEIDQIAEICKEREGITLKVIIETCLLTEEEKIALCHIVSASDADFIKTSTGFSTGGATPEDIALMRRFCSPEIKIKAAGGISSFADAEEMVKNGANRLGTSRLVKLALEEQKA